MLFICEFTTSRVFLGKLAKGYDTNHYNKVVTSTTEYTNDPPWDDKVTNDIIYNN